MYSENNFPEGFFQFDYNAGLHDPPSLAQKVSSETNYVQEVS